MIFEYYLEKGGFAPVFFYKDDAGADLFSPEKITLYPGKQYVLDLKLKLFCPPGFYAAIVPKSGLAAKDGISITNSPGTIDSGYTGNVMVILENRGRFTKDFNIGDKVAQVIFKKKEKVELKQVFEIPTSERNEGGLGSTGK